MPGAPAMDSPPPGTEGRRVSTVVERKLDELCACLDDALSCRQRSPYAEERLLADIKARTDFLRSLLVAEWGSHGGARPEPLAAAEERFAVLEDTFVRWARRGAPAPEADVEQLQGVGEPPEDDADEAGRSRSSGSACSCTDSCHEAAAAAGDAVATRQEVASSGGGVAEDRGAERDAAGAREVVALDAVAAEKREAAVGAREVVVAAAAANAVAKKSDAEREASAEARRRAAHRRRWWRWSAAWCGAAGVVAVVAVGVAVELAAVAHHNVNVYYVPT